MSEELIILLIAVGSSFSIALMCGIYVNYKIKECNRIGQKINWYAYGDIR